ncbi:MAG: hypothetical protein WC679_01285 [Bacteroidales bacterium]|jgi:hypothetical protein
MIFQLFKSNSFVKLVEAKDIKEAISLVPEMANPEICTGSETSITWAFSVTNGIYYQLSEFVYTIKYHFFRVGNISSKEYTTLEAAEYWFNRFNNDPNYSSVSKNW